MFLSFFLPLPFFFGIKKSWVCLQPDYNTICIQLNSIYFYKQCFDKFLFKTKSLCIYFISIWYFLGNLLLSDFMKFPFASSLLRHLQKPRSRAIELTRTFQEINPTLSRLQRQTDFVIRALAILRLKCEV